MKIRNPFNKKTPFDAVGINSNSPDKYRQLYDYMMKNDSELAYPYNIYCLVPISMEYESRYIEDR